MKSEMKILMVVKSFKSTVKEAEKKQEIFPRAGTSDLTERALEGRKSLHRRKKSWELEILRADNSGGKSSDVHKLEEKYIEPAY